MSKSPFEIVIPERTPEEEHELVEFMLGKEFADNWMASKDSLNPNMRMVTWDVENNCWRRDE